MNCAKGPCYKYCYLHAKTITIHNNSVTRPTAFAITYHD